MKTYRAIKQQMSESLILLLLLIVQFSYGCMAAIGAAPFVMGGIAAGVVAGQAINAAKDQHPEVNFDKDYPETVTYQKPYDSVYQASIKALSFLNEQTEATDKESGIINTKKVEFGEKPGAIAYGLGKKIFFQRKSIFFKRVTGNQTEVSVKVFFSRKGALTDEAEFIDEKASNVVRAIFYDKLDMILKETHVKKKV